MKRCPECRRDYHDDTLSFCLADGMELVYGLSDDEPATAILSEPGAVVTGFPAGESPTRQQIHTRAAEAEPGGSLSDASEKRSFSAHRAAKPLFAVAVATVLLVGAYLGYRYFASTKQIESIAVMPFVNESGNADIEYLSDGMTEILIGNLSQLPNLNVKARTSVFRYKGKEIDPQQVSRELNVQAILTGRVVQRANNLTLYVELIDTATENVLWKADYNRSMTDLISLQKEIAQDVSQKLRSKLSEADTQKLAKKNYPANPEALQLYMQGRFFWNKRRIAEMGKAIGYFQQAIDIDPNYALAYAGLADAVAQPSDVVPYRERPARARAAVLKALSLDSDLAEARTALGHILLRYDLNFVDSERELKRALELDPKWVDTYQRLGELYIALGRTEESLAAFRRGLEIEPFSLPLNDSYGAALFLARRYDESIAQLNRSLEMDPNGRNAHVGLARAYGQKGMYAESVKHRAITLELGGLGQFAVRIREAFDRNGWKGYLQAEYERLAATPVRDLDRLAYASEAVTLAALGEKDKAFAAMEKSLEASEQPSLVFLKVDPRFDPLRDDPRFPGLLRKIGFPE